MTEAVTGRLTGTGWTDWAGVREVLGQDECFWVDLAGPHHAPAPAQLPVGATHLWSWRPDRWVRVRIDDDRALATVLTAGGTSGVATTAMDSEGVPWKQHSRAAGWDHPVTLRITQGSTPITFVEVHPAPDQR